MFKLNKTWKGILKPEFEKDYYKELISFLKNEYCTKNIYPIKENVFNALNLVEPNNVKVVILGQDPYHQKGQSHGLSFSVEEGIKIPPSLRNIYKELKEDIGLEISNSGNLTNWGKQGVLLLNTVLTVEDSKPNSHKKKGWQNLTTQIITKLNEGKTPIVFMLWGNNARSFKKIINTEKHLVLETVHPSPLSAYGGFLGCKHFSKANKFLKANNIAEIDWMIENI